MRRQTWVGGFTGAMAVLGGVLGYHRNWNVPPDCYSTLTRSLVRSAMVQTLAMPATSNYRLPRELEGGFLATRFVCNAEITRDLNGRDPDGRIMHYTTALDRATGAPRIQVRLDPGPR